MANTNFPMGFVPIKYQNGMELSTEEGNIAAANEAIYIHDLLEKRSDGLIHVAQATSTTLVGVAAEYKAANATTSTVLYYPLESIQLPPVLVQRLQLFRLRSLNCMRVRTRKRTFRVHI